jgi:hypothetical protein
MNESAKVALVGKLDVLHVGCDNCGSKGRYHVA